MLFGLLLCSAASALFRLKPEPIRAKHISTLHEPSSHELDYAKACCYY